jgi:multidrug efflux pump subunit AcrB
MVRYPEALRNSLAGLRQMRVRLPGGGEAPLETVATVEEQRSFATIQRIDGVRSATVGADVNPEITTPNEVISMLSDSIMAELERRHPQLTWGVEGESRDRREDLRELSRNLGIALLIIVVLLGTLLRSYVQPLIVMAVIPFAFIGAFLGHLLMGFNLSFVSIFGLVALSGVVINDSVVLIDYFNSQRETKSTFDALQGAIRRRFRPVLLTTMTTSLGLLPMLLETSLQAQFLIPMAISLAFGLLFGTAVIVVLVPVLVMIARDLSWHSRER